MAWRRHPRRGLLLAVAALCLFTAVTALSFRAPADDFRTLQNIGAATITDRQGRPLAVSYQTRWNTADALPLHAMPELLPRAFVAAEDRRFYEHHGVDWLARGHALYDRMTGHAGGRGASTITEQVVRLLHPRPRNYWSKWVEGLEAMALERSVSKADILEFYLNQVPYAANRRGVAQASRYYFGRDPGTLNAREMLALVVLVRAPSTFDLRRGKVSIDGAIARLAAQLQADGGITPETAAAIGRYDVKLADAVLPVDAFHFVDYLRAQPGASAVDGRIRTTLDGGLQAFVSQLLETRVLALAPRKVTGAAALVIDRRTQEILAWVSVGAGCAESRYQAPACQIDMVGVPRQPGSALKPFLYATALAKGWTAATLIDDSPMSDRVGDGLHHFHNYSHTYYGPVRLRQALGNSLNIPAVRTINFVGPRRYLDVLHDLGFNSLQKEAAFYDDGLALGNGEVTLLELVQAYGALANRGVYAEATPLFGRAAASNPRRVFSPEVASLIGNILSDPWARLLEFGRGSVLNMPAQTAVKTGTSTDYRDAWAVGYDSRYVAGIWMGNADYAPMDGVTGAIGPALALRGIFNELDRREDTEPLYLSPRLVRRDICIDPQAAAPDCATYSEYFLPGTGEQPPAARAEALEIARPPMGLEMALDPRLAPEDQVFVMRLRNAPKGAPVEWRIDGALFATTPGDSLNWPVTRGRHRVQATVLSEAGPLATPENKFIVK